LREVSIDSSIQPAVSRASWAQRWAKFRTSSATAAKPSRFSSARRLDRGVERQDIRLKSNLVDHFDDVRDLIARCIDLLHFVHHAVERLIQALSTASFSDATAPNSTFPSILSCLPVGWIFRRSFRGNGRVGLRQRHFLDPILRG